MKKNTLITLITTLIICNINAQIPYKIKQLMGSDSFETVLDTNKWFVELSPQINNDVRVKNKQLVVDVANGATIWWTKKLKNKWVIEFDRTIPIAHQTNDRLSDFNVFWQATDPHSGKLMGRTPAFENYDSLRLYYVGFGGNTNTTTRFRKYQGTGERTLLAEYTDSTHLLVANTTYHCRIIFKIDTMDFYINDVLFFSFKDKQPLKHGYFGFRTTQSRQLIDNFRVFQIK
jgi:Domain of unknown function (DUF6250)